MKLIKWITSSLRAKLLSMFIILTAVPLLVVGLISYQKSYNTVSDHSKASTQLVADQLARNMDNLFGDTERILEMGKNPQVLQFLYSQSETYEDAKSILQTFKFYRETYKYDKVLNISMVNFYGKGISERKGVFQLDRNPLRNPYFQYLTQYPDAILRIPESAYSDLNRLDGFTYPGQNALSIIAAVKQRITHEVIGFIIIDLNEAMIDDFLANTVIGKTGFFYINDHYGETVFQPQSSSASRTILEQIAEEPMTAQNDSFVLSTKSKPQFIVYSTSEITGWKIVGVVPFQEIIAEANGIRQLIIVSVVLSAIFALTLYFFLTNRLTLPIQILMNKMRKAANGYLDAKVTPTGTDEIADLGNSFNIMIEEIKSLIDKNRREQEQKQMAELRTLQAQINPHFLYNTLDSIIWMAEAEKKESVIKLVKALSRFFRLSLNKGRDWVSIKTELEHAHNYLVIQQMRYHDILQYEMDVDPELQVYPIMKMTLQPLIENAIYHGIKNKRGQGLIRIVGYAQDRDIILTIEDNGIGMTPERLAQLQEELEMPIDSLTPKQDDDEGGFGLLNVHHRIRLYFGLPYGIEMESIHKEGSKISIRIPKK
ncbi:sensor histidine kinase [Paenibacillus lupini]|uniref:sensor histidine kinase n=1 Tax=Paenibacillus lupini TaxID=1450204 RepID=UPI00141FFBB4|nr:sensor histidine kinase [Paenibacillus lupini]NIK25547.1 two-component system sensor histidine kinase YesM [Paenibacillus lupini]